jgi:hypothetical protein
MICCSSVLFILGIIILAKHLEERKVDEKLKPKLPEF